jgi:hypothetical protein
MSGNHSNGAKSAWINRKDTTAYPFEVDCRIRWAGTTSHSSFRARCYDSAHRIAFAIVNALAEPNDIRVEINGPKTRLIMGPPETVKQLLRQTFA